MKKPWAIIYIPGIKKYDKSVYTRYETEREANNFMYKLPKNLKIDYKIKDLSK